MYDYVIVGGGSAGCVLAARLSEMSDVRVLLLEAGPTDNNRYIHWPVGFSKMTAGPFTWGLRTAPQRHAANREIPFAQARVIGGGSSINAEVFTRGCPADYDRWANEEGCPGWSLRRGEALLPPLGGQRHLRRRGHGTDGPLGVSSLSPNLMTKVFVQACQQAGIPYNPDFNGAQQAGSGVYQTTTRNARRCSTVVGYLRPAMGRRNLQVETAASPPGS